MARTAAALIVGNELLSGKIQEANLIELARLLRLLGIELQRVVVVQDDIPTIAREVSQLASSYDHLFTSGGVGPTHDDVTIQGIAEAFRVPIVSHPALEKLIHDHYGDELNEGKLRLALMPEGARLVHASGSRWPATVMKNVWILPGIPEVFRMKLPIIREHLGTDTPYITRAVYTKMDEPDLKSLLDPVVDEHPEVEIGSYPTWSDPKYRTKVTFDGKKQEAIDRAVDEFLQCLPEGEPQWTD